MHPVADTWHLKTLSIAHHMCACTNWIYDFMLFCIRHFHSFLVDKLHCIF